MSTFAPLAKKIVYPESDGQPMAENPVQARWIVTLHGNLEALFRDRDEVLVAMDHFWYPEESRSDIRTAPDVYVALGRPKGDRPSYKQWEEDGIPPSVVFAIVSPSNRGGEMARKFRFYEHYGVEEYYIYDPDVNCLTAFKRTGRELKEVAVPNGWISPLLGIRFDLTSGPEMIVYRPDGQRFLTFLELSNQAEREKQRADRLAAKLRAAGIDPDA